jgi:hypothetical protein
VACGSAANGHEQQGYRATGDHHSGNRHRDGDLQEGLIPVLAVQDGRQRVVDDLRGGVEQVGLYQCERAGGCRLDE